VAYQASGCARSGLAKCVVIRLLQRRCWNYAGESDGEVTLYSASLRFFGTSALLCIP
jgi:hypothetical protein